MTFGENKLLANIPDFETAKPQTDGGETMEIQIHTGASAPDVLSPPKFVSSPRRLDEYEIDFADPRAFVVMRWQDIGRFSIDAVSVTGLQPASTVASSQDLASEIQTKIADPKLTPTMKRQLSRVLPLPQIIARLARNLSELVAPYALDYSILWKLIYLSLKMSYTSSTRLERVSNALLKVQRTTELFNGHLAKLQKQAEASIAIVDFLDPLLEMLVDVVAYLQASSSEQMAEKNWPNLNTTMKQQMSNLYRTVEHVSELSRIAPVSPGLVEEPSQRLKSLIIIPRPETTQIATSVTFPVTLLPYDANPTFRGRQEELKRIETFLNRKSDQGFKTYSLYGRRGVGKTSLALQFAHSCAGDGVFDAIFWVQCETSVTIRQSFDKIAEALKIPGAERDESHEENLITIKHWLKNTLKTWLLIFDNVESDKVLRPYWPDGDSGAVLVTSRAYTNFIKDANRQAQTVKPLDPKQSWDLLLDLLGDRWKALEVKRKILDSEIAAAKSMINQLEGLPLTIEQTANLITDETVGGRTIARTHEAFKDRIRSLPERLSISRSISERALDALWDITFKGLSRHARSLIGVLAWLSPDAVPIQIFQLKDPSLLYGKLAFCRPVLSQALHSSVTISPAFDKAICELQEKKLIKYNNQVLSIHRVVQEAVNFESAEDLQESFDAATKLVSDQFPKRLIIDTMYQDWSRCKQYIPHVASLSKKLSEYSKSLVLKGTTDFVELLAHSSWYLFELGDYDACGEIIDTALAACQDKNALLYSRLRGIQGGLFFDLNLLSKCREAWEETLRIREGILPHDDPHVAGMVSNLGNLELAEGNIPAALKYYERALQVWINSNAESAQPLAKTYLSLGRAHMYQGNLDKALRYTAAAETVAERGMSSGSGFIANIHYAYGDIHFRGKDFQSAIKSYNACLKISTTKTPLHPIVGATWYSMACVEAAQGNVETALWDLEKAEAISRLRSPARDDGPIARILWKRATILEIRSVGTNKEEVFKLKAKATEINHRLEASGEGGMIPDHDDNSTEKDKEEDSYDALVPLFYR